MAMETLALLWPDSVRLTDWSEGGGSGGPPRGTQVTELRALEAQIEAMARTKFCRSKDSI